MEGMDVAEARRLRALEEENGRLKRLVADQAVRIQILKEVNSKKMVSPSSQRRAVKMIVEEGTGRAAQARRTHRPTNRAMLRKSRFLLTTPKPVSSSAARQPQR
jgi:hypothetical protein